MRGELVRTVLAGGLAIAVSTVTLAQGRGGGAPAAPAPQAAPAQQGQGRGNFVPEPVPPAQAFKTSTEHYNFLMRLHKGGIPFLWAHLERLYEGAKALDFSVGLTPDELVKRIFDCLTANGMTDGVHIRLMVTRGIKATPYEDPRVTIGDATIVIIPATVTRIVVVRDNPAKYPPTGPKINFSMLKR